MVDKLEKSLRDAIAQADKYYDDANIAWFDFLSEDAVVYAINHTEPYRTAAEYRERFGPILQRSKRKTKIMSRDVQIMGESAVVAQTLQVTEDNVVANLRQSVVWQKENETWLIKHLHTALIGMPSAKKQPNNIGEVTVLNERIATIAAVLGVAQ